MCFWFEVGWLRAAHPSAIVGCVPPTPALMVLGAWLEPLDTTDDVAYLQDGDSAVVADSLDSAVVDDPQAQPLAGRDSVMVADPQAQPLAGREFADGLLPPADEELASLQDTMTSKRQAIQLLDMCSAGENDHVEQQPLPQSPLFEPEPMPPIMDLTSRWLHARDNEPKMASLRFIAALERDLYGSSAMSWTSDLCAPSSSIESLSSPATGPHATASHDGIDESPTVAASSNGGFEPTESPKSPTESPKSPTKPPLTPLPPTESPKSPPTPRSPTESPHVGGQGVPSKIQSQPLAGST